ncbi:MAG: hypothetical protein ACRESS_00040 [Stenotrophobium sp.]
MIQRTYPIVPGEIGVVDTSWPLGWVPRYGASAALKDNSAAFNNCVKSLVALGGGDMLVPCAESGAAYRFIHAFHMRSGVHLKGVGGRPVLSSEVRYGQQVANVPSRLMMMGSVAPWNIYRFNRDACADAASGDTAVTRTTRTQDFAVGDTVVVFSADYTNSNPAFVAPQGKVFSALPLWMRFNQVTSVDDVVIGLKYPIDQDVVNPRIANNNTLGVVDHYGDPCYICTDACVQGLDIRMDGGNWLGETATLDCVFCDLDTHGNVAAWNGIQRTEIAHIRSTVTVAGIELGMCPYKVDCHDIRMAVSITEGSLGNFRPYGFLTCVENPKEVFFNNIDLDMSGYGYPDLFFSNIGVVYLACMVDCGLDGLRVRFGNSPITRPAVMLVGGTANLAGQGGGGSVGSPGLTGCNFNNIQISGNSALLCGWDCATGVPSDNRVITGNTFSNILIDLPNLIGIPFGVAGRDNIYNNVRCSQWDFPVYG